MSFKRHFNEALKLSTARSAMKRSGKEYKNIRNDVFEGKDRIILPDEIKISPQRQIDGRTFEDIRSHLLMFGYNIIASDDYIRGFANPKLGPDYKAIKNMRFPVYNNPDDFPRYTSYKTDSDNETKIGKVLSKIIKFLETNPDDFRSKFLGDYHRIYQTFQADPRRNKDITKQRFKIVISRHPYDIYGMSTDRMWTSCMNIGPQEIAYKKNKGRGEHAGSISDFVHQKGLIAYLISENEIDSTGDKCRLQKPLSRINIVPHVSDIKDSGDMVYGVGKMYGIQIPEFRDAVIKFTDDILNINPDGNYKLAPGVYDDTGTHTNFTVPEVEESINTKNFKQYLTEDPDSGTTLDKGSTHYTDSDGITFGVINNILFYTNMSTHHTLSRYIAAQLDEDDPDRGIKNTEGLEYKTIILGEPVININVAEVKLLSGGEFQNGGRYGFDIAGRLWTKSKLISFWNRFESVKKHFPIIIKFLEEMGLNPTETGYEFIDSEETLTWSELGIEELENKKSSSEIAKALAKQHIASPLEKEPKKNVPPMKRIGKLSPTPGVQLSPGGRPIIGDSVNFKNIFKRVLVEENSQLPYAIFIPDARGDEFRLIFTRIQDDMYVNRYVLHKGNWVNAPLYDIDKNNPNNWISYNIMMKRDKHSVNPLQMSKSKFEEWATLNLL